MRWVEIIDVRRKIQMSKTDDKTAFRRVPGGYKREDVNAFILSLDNKAHESDESSKAKLSELAEQLEKKEAECAVLETKLSEKDAEISRIETLLKEKDETIASLRSDITSRELAFSGIVSELTDVKRRFAEANARADIAEAAAALDKSTAKPAPADAETPGVTAPKKEEEKPTVIPAKKQTRKMTYTLELPFRKKNNR